MHSAIYEGRLRHRRFHPKYHQFEYTTTLFYIDLDELAEIFAEAPCWSINRKTPGSFRRRDYLGDPQLELKIAVREEVVRQLGYCPMGAIRMLTNLRMWGSCFNPVTFYYVFDENEKNPALILAQVNNTPWKDRHCYIIHCDKTSGKTRQSFAKEFHVSPFNPIDMDYRWLSTPPGDSLLVHMETCHHQLCHMDATLALTRRPWSGTLLTKILWRQPWMSIKVPLAIYWQALKLALKRIPVYAHSRPINANTRCHLALKIDKQG